MPRNPATKKNQHNNRHENGLVGPGKRVTKQRSNGQLNGNVKAPLPDEPVPVIPNLESQTPPPASISSAFEAPSYPNPYSSLTKRGSESSTDERDQKWDNINGNPTASLRRPNMAQTKTRSLQDINAGQMALTILRSCPVGDTVSLLIVLLALPTMILMVVQGLFACLTLMPSTQISSASFLSIFDVFQGPFGSPSLGTMAVVDVICFGLWVCLWNWAQHFAVDLAQIQIAMTLGSGNSSKSGSVHILCLVLVLVMHMIRSSSVRHFFLSKLIPESLFANPTFVALIQYLPAESDFGESPGPRSKFFGIFAIHILSQALMAFVRRKVKSTQGSSGARSVRRGDAEFNSVAMGIPEPLDLDLARATATGVDYQVPPTPGSRDLNRSANAKKRRRQVNQAQVRNKQPFWAALASTKVYVLREAEHNSGQSGTVTELSASALQAQDLVRITNVEPSTIEFEASIGSSSGREHETASNSNMRPIFVRINEARWQVSLEPLSDAAKSRYQWRGTIAGLAPDCTYTCSFNRDDDEEVASIMVKTPALQDRDLPPSLIPSQPRASLRPQSPTTTLKNSIANVEVKLAEVKARLTKARKTHRAGVSRIEKDVETFKGRLNSNGDENRQRQKLQQAERSIQQTEIATREITATLDELEAIPEDDDIEYEKKKALFEERSKLVTAANEGLITTRAEAKQELSLIQNELNQLNSRKERIQGRQTKLAEQHDRITQANVQGMNEKERKAQESARIEADRLRHENELSDGLKHMYIETQDLSNRTAQYAREVEGIEKQVNAQREAMMRNNGPLTPEGNLPGTNPPQNRSFNFAQYQPPGLLANEAQSSPFLPFAKTIPSENRRPRSNTNRSIGAISNFSADAFEDADPIPPMPSNIDYDTNALNGRKSSGSSRGKNNGSPAGVIGDGFRGIQKGSQSPGQMPGTSTW